MSKVYETFIKPGDIKVSLYSEGPLFILPCFQVHEQGHTGFGDISNLTFCEEREAAEPRCRHVKQMNSLICFYSSAGSLISYLTYHLICHLYWEMLCERRRRFETVETVELTEGKK